MLGDDTIIWPGHGAPSTIGAERPHLDEWVDARLVGRSARAPAGRLLSRARTRSWNCETSTSRPTASPSCAASTSSVAEGEVHALMGPNGAGKSTLANVVMGHPGYGVTEGQIRLRGEDITAWAPDERARAGIFLAFQYPEAIGGVSVIQFLRQAIAARKGLDELSVLEVRLDLAEWMDRLGMDPAFAERHLNEGFSGGERKRNEILQMALLEPVIALLDETDSGLDIDALRVVARGVRTVRDRAPRAWACSLVTHYVKLLDEIEPDHVHVLVDGRIVALRRRRAGPAHRARGLRRLAHGDRRDQLRRPPRARRHPRAAPGHQRPAHHLPRLGRDLAAARARSSRR